MPVVLDQCTDDELLAMDGSDAFAYFYRRHVEWVLGMLARRSGDPELAADLCAEVFAAAYLHRKRFTPRDGTANGWLFRIAQNKLRDSLRRRKAEQRACVRLGLERPELDDSDLAEIERLGESARLVRLVEELPGDQRDVVRARIIDERDYEDIAGELAVSEAVVRKRVSRGLTRMRKGMRNR